MFDIEKLVSSVLAFVNFFTARIIVACLLFGGLYVIAGVYYFKLVASYIDQSPLTEAMLKSYIGKAGEYVTPGNVQNAIFVIALIVSLSLVDLTYRLVQAVGGLLPVTMAYNPSNCIDMHIATICDAWRYYSKKLEIDAFKRQVSERAELERLKYLTVAWWKDLFDYCKSFIIIIIIFYLLTPRSDLRITVLSLIIAVTLAAICMIVCTLIESARYANDMDVAIERAILTLIAEAKDPPISHAELEKELKNVTFWPAPSPWRNKFLSVFIIVGVRYFGTAAGWLRAYRAQHAKPQPSKTTRPIVGRRKH